VGKLLPCLQAIARQKEDSAVSVKLECFLPFLLKELEHNFTEKVIELCHK